jgi:beta-glucosidase
MKYLRLLILGALSFLLISMKAPDDRKTVKNAEIEKKVDELLAKMTLEEKVGQMTQVAIDLISKGQDGISIPHEIDMQKLETAITKYHVGSILNVANSAYSVDHWYDIITKIQDVALGKTRLKIPVLYGIDAIHGANYTKDATMFPQPFAMAASWNREIARKIGEIAAYETRASGIPWNFSPVCDLGRQPLWPRFWETMGEDVYLEKTLIREYVTGQQGDDFSKPQKVLTCLKHYIGYSYPFNGKDRTPAWIPERMLREYFLPPFEEGLKAGSMSVMVNSGEINGIPAHSDPFLLKTILREELGFKGLVVSDWNDIERLYTRDRVADSPKEAVRMAVMAGVDMSMIPLDFSFYDLLLELAKEGSVPVSRIDEAVKNILRVKFLTGIFDSPYPDKSLKSKFACKEFTDFNLESAQEVITLLKNKNNILPLSKKSKVVITGPTADLLNVLNGGWSITWQGNVENLYPQEKYTVKEAIEEKIGKNNIEYLPGVNFEKEIDIQKVVESLKKNDAAIVCLGEPSYCETPGNIDNLTLDEIQEKLVLELQKTGKPVILILIEGRPRIITKLEPKANAIVLGYRPGMEGGRAIADVLFGDFNPCGKLPFTYPKDVNAITPYDYKPLEVKEGNSVSPLFNFGFGLSYTNFEYTDLTIDKPVIKENENVNVSIKIRNTGKIAGKEIVQLYLTDLFGSVSRPVKQIKGFEKILLQPGEIKEVKFTIPYSELSFIGRENKRIVEPGKFVVTVGPFEKEFELK